MDKEQTIIAYLQEQNNILAVRLYDLEEEKEQRQKDIEWFSQDHQQKNREISNVLQLLQKYLFMFKLLIDENCSEEIKAKGEKISAELSKNIQKYLHYMIGDISEIEIAFGRDE